MLAWLSVWSEVQTFIRPSWCRCHSLSLAPVKSRLVLPFWYRHRLTWVVPEKWPLNGCVCVCFWYRLTWVITDKAPLFVCVRACVCRWHICGCAWRSRRLSRGVASFWSVTMATAGPAHHRYVSAWLPRSVVARRRHQQNGAGNTRHAVTTVCKLEPIGT